MLHLRLKQAIRRSARHPARAGLIGLVLATSAACTPSPSPAIDPPNLAAGVAAPDVQPPTEPTPTPAPEPTPEEKARITDALTAIEDRHACNRVTGCPPMVALMQDLPVAVPAILQMLGTKGNGDGYWIEMLIELLGQSDDPRALRALEAFSRDRRWTVKLRAVVNLGRLGAHTTEATRDLLAEAETMATTAGDNAWLAAVLATRAELLPSERGALRARLLALYPTTEAAVQAVPAPVLDWLVIVAVAARLTEAAPTLRWACLSTNRFVSVNAIDGVAAFRDTGAVPYLLKRIEDQQPTVRRRTLAALQAITGMHHADTPSEWRAWAATHKLDTIPGTTP